MSAARCASPGSRGWSRQLYPLPQREARLQKPLIIETEHWHNPSTPPDNQRYFWRATALVAGRNRASRLASFKTADHAPRLMRSQALPNVRTFVAGEHRMARRVRQGVAYRSAGLNSKTEHIYFTKRSCRTC